MHQKLIVGRLACACPIACGAHYFHLRERDERQKVENPGVAGRFSFFLFPVWLLAALLDAPTDLVPEAFHMQMSQSFTFRVFFDDFFRWRKEGPTHFRVNKRLYACARYSGPRADENRCGGDGCTSSDCGCRWMLFL